MDRLRGVSLALGALVVLLWGAWAVERRAAPPAVAAPVAVFRFDEEDLVGFRVERGDETIAVRRRAGVWEMTGASWRPRLATVRRVAHQLHDLDARATVSEGDPSVYGLGPDATRVTLLLADGAEHTLRVGDLNPTGVSVYIQPGGSGPIRVVQKAAMDVFSEPILHYREDRITAFDTPDAVALTVTVHGETLRVERTGAASWHQTVPTAQPAPRDAVRRLLGGVAALRVQRFVADAPDDRADWGLAPPLHTLEVVLGSGRVVAVEVGAAVPGADPALRFVYLPADDAVYAVKDGFLGALVGPRVDGAPGSAVQSLLSARPGGVDAIEPGD